jgi:hypothetical protein
MTIVADLIIRLLCVLYPQDGQALRSYDPANLASDEIAAEHVWTARVAAEIAGVDADEVLAIAQHESNFISNVVSPEIAAGGVSCGVMTPTVERKCEQKTLLEQYQQGARHLRGWYDATGFDRPRAFQGLAGGYALIRSCESGPVLNKRGIDGCKYADDISWRIRGIHAARRKLVGS